MGVNLPLVKIKSNQLVESIKNDPKNSLITFHYKNKDFKIDALSFDSILIKEVICHVVQNEERRKIILNRVRSSRGYSKPIIESVIQYVKSNTTQLKK